MPDIYIIAGPPGIGKSTSGVYFIPEDIPIIDPDQIAQKYKAEGFTDYKDIGNMRFQDLVRKKLFSGSDFAIELNLGFPSHYEYVRSLKAFSTQNNLNVILFFTDDINLCYTRARIRHENGLHLVPVETIKEMYEATIPLLMSGFSLFSNFIALDVNNVDSEPVMCMSYNSTNNKLQIADKIPAWAKKDLKIFLETTSLSKTLDKQRSEVSKKLTPIKRVNKSRKRGRGL